MTISNYPLLQTGLASVAAYYSGQLLSVVFAQVPIPPIRVLSVDGGALLFSFWAGLYMGWLLTRKQDKNGGK